MYENPLPLEYHLEEKLRVLGIRLGQRVSGEALEGLAAEDDEVNALLDRPTRADVEFMQPADAIGARLFELSTLQNEFLSSNEDRGYEILFRRTLYSKPWKIDYEATRNLDAPEIHELVDIDYDDSSFFMITPNLDGTMRPEFHMTLRELRELPLGIRSLYREIKKLRRRPFNPEQISDVIVKLLRIKESL